MPGFLLAFALLTILLVPGLILTSVGDTARWVSRRRPWMATRMLLFAWVYMANQAIWLFALLVTWITGGLGLSARSKKRLETTSYAIQLAWARNLFVSFRKIFRVGLEVEGDEVATPGPIVLFLRHASIADVLLPNVLVTRRHGIYLRYVLKKELLIDPSLDIAGNRLVNHFVDRGGDTGAEVEQVRALTEDLTETEGVIIYPEGTRFTAAKRQRVIEKLGGRDSALSRRAVSLQNVLPPRPGGPLVLLDAGTDVVVAAHTGLESLAGAKDAWRGDIVGSTLKVSFWRIAAADIPEDRVGRVQFLFDQWDRVDAWIGENRAR